MPGKENIDNASAYPSFYYAKHLAAGLAGYENETILIDTDALKEMMPTFIGKPIVVNHQNIELNNLEKRDGTVIESFYNELDGCAWTKMLIETDAARQAIANGFSVSNCYQPTEWGNGGKHHNVAYDRKIKNGIFKHLAIVSNPRYEEAKIYTPEEFNLYQKEKRDKLKILQNAKEDKKMIKFFRNTREEVKEIDEDTCLEIDGKEISVKEMINAVTEAEKAKKNKENALNVDLNTEVEVDGIKMSLKDLTDKYNVLKNSKKCDKTDDEDEEEKKKKAEEMKNALIEAEKIAEAEKQAKLKHYEDVMNASNKSKIGIQPIRTASDGLALGKSLYGSAE